MVWSLLSPGSKRMTSMGTLGRSKPLPLPWKAVQVAPLLVVRKRWPIEAGTGVQPSLRTGAAVEASQVWPLLVQAAMTNWQGKATEVVKRSNTPAAPVPVPTGVPALVKATVAAGGTESTPTAK